MRIESVDVDAGKMSLSMKPAESLGIFTAISTSGTVGKKIGGKVREIDIYIYIFTHIYIIINISSTDN